MGSAETEEEEFCTLLMSTIRHPAAEKSSKETEGWLWWHILTVSPLGRQKQECWELKISLHRIPRPGPKLKPTGIHE